MKSIRSLLFLALGMAASTVNAFTLNVSFLGGVPAQMDFAYAVSTGNCATAPSVNCQYTHSSMSGIAGSKSTEFFALMNSAFKDMGPVADGFNKPTNFVEFKIEGQSGVCHIDLLGRTDISVAIDKNGNCA